jgi:PAS domain S-box-containing protein
VHDLHPASDQLRLRQLFSSLATGERVKAELAFLRPDGSLLPVEVSAAAQSMQGEIYYIGSFRDISARVQAETALRQSEARRRAIFEHAGTGIEVSALDGTILEVNHAFLNMHGWALDEVIGRDRRALMHPEDGSRTNDNRALMAQTRAGPQQATVRRLRKTGAAFWADVTLTAVSYGDGRDLLVALIQDVDVRHQADEDRRRHAADLQAAWQAAEQASAAKTRFLATASHDLRQPIQAVQLLVHLLAQQDVGAEAATLVARIREVFNALGGIIDALLDISKLDAGLVQPDWETCRLGPLLRQVVAEFGPLAAEKGLSLRAVQTRAVVLTDRGLLTRILRNLVANAVRYTEQGGIVVGCRRYATGLELCIVDTGCGIAEEQRSEIFREFHQLGNAARDRREGLGLGLAIVDRLARLLGCRITVRSRLGRGTCFGVGLRLAAPGRETSPAADQLGLPMAYGGELILVVEDEEDIRESLGQVLRAWGYRVALAADGDAALGCLNPADPPTLLLVDYRLGEMSGVEFVNTARRRLRTNLRALLLTGDAAAECRREAAGNNIALLYKPVQPDKLRDELARITSSRPPQRKRYPAAAMRRELADYQDDL